MELLDLGILRGYIGDDQDQIVEMLKVFLAELSLVIDNLQDAISLGDHKRVYENFHKIRASLGYFGFFELASQMSSFEKNLDIDAVLMDINVQEKIRVIMDKLIVVKAQAEFTLSQLS
jgi:HPt (histidine-containing phosphotransfer) domain-containing protein